MGFQERLSQETVVQSETVPKLRKGHSSDQRKPAVLAGVYQGQVQAAIYQNYPVFDPNEEAEASQTVSRRFTP